MTNILTLRDMYRNATALLKEHRLAEYPPHSVVRSREARAQWGIVCLDGGSPPDRLPIIFENGNVWWKEFHEWEVVKDRRLWPKWVAKMRRKYAKKTAPVSR
jgi:hypothetical protein